VPGNNPEFQGFLENENDAAAVYPDVSAELLGVTLKNDDYGQSLHVVSDEEEPDFCYLAAASLDNAGIDPSNCMQAAWDLAPENCAPWWHGGASNYRCQQQQNHTRDDF
jgi:hypothetical protein